MPGPLSSNDERRLEALCASGASFYARGYAHGSTGNLSVRIGDRIFVTPTGGSLGALRPEDLAEVSLDGRALNDRPPSKEAPFHLAIYRHRPDAEAVVHLHAPWSVALSCLDDPTIQPLTPYFVMRVAPLGVVPYVRPGSPGLAAAVEAAAADHACLLLRNHGSICAGASLGEAVDRAEELEATARLQLTLRGERTRPLTAADIEELERVFVRRG
jgi:ribulose-5-phosphate 4-epimerase/fuculose-1-phosphate aldolase